MLDVHDTLACGFHTSSFGPLLDFVEHYVDGIDVKFFLYSYMHLRSMAGVNTSGYIMYNAIAIMAKTFKIMPTSQKCD
jgi:hypothetical protein